MPIRVPSTKRERKDAPLLFGRGGGNLAGAGLAGGGQGGGGQQVGGGQHCEKHNAGHCGGGYI